MSHTIFVAAGGGGDAIAASLLHTALHNSDEPAIVATYAWDRLLVDPLPGPRRPQDLDGLKRLGVHNFEVVPESKPRTPGGSTLPRLARSMPARLMLLDPYGGVSRMAEQIAELVELTGTERVDVVDVGGDVLGKAHDSGLRSPLADALALAAVGRVQVPGRLLVAGPGLDGELPEDLVRARLSEVGADHVLSLTRDHLTKEWLDLLTWHPSEATALWVAAALGLRGIVEVRDSGAQVNLTSEARDVWGLDLSRALEASPIARSILEAQPDSLADVEAVVVRAVGRSELEYERAKASRQTEEPLPAITELGPEVAALEQAARARGASFVTFRRLAEGVGCPSQLDALREWLVEAHAEQYTPPLWSVAA